VEALIEEMEGRGMEDWRVYEMVPRCAKSASHDCFRSFPMVSPHCSFFIGHYLFFLVRWLIILYCIVWMRLLLLSAGCLAEVLRVFCHF
jgi:hypothetical protein